MRGDDDGFTLVEVLVSLILISVATAIIASHLSSGRAAISASQQSSDLVIVARSKIAELGTARPLHIGKLSGSEANGISWEISMDPYPVDSQPDQVGPAAYLVVATAWRDGGGRQSKVSLQTIKTTLGHAP
mgnify:CR=1 FL=1